MAGKQLVDDARAAPSAISRRFTDSGRAGRCINIAELEAAARRALPVPVSDFIDGAAGDEVTTRRNRGEFCAHELELSMALLGCGSIQALDRSCIAATSAWPGPPLRSHLCTGRDRGSPPLHTQPTELPAGQRTP
jgi:hypothetical protein